MRFNKIEEYPIDDLLLDEENPRISSAQDQNRCINMIHERNKAYFSNLLNSIAEDDLGEPLLVHFNEEGEKIIKDGNRRAAVLKVLRKPELAPTASIKRKAEDLKSRHEINFYVQAQVSSDLGKVLKTVYERHAAGKGLSRVAWDALASARFNYQSDNDDSTSWQPTALLIETENQYPSLTTFINSEIYSHEVFRRLVRAAKEKGIINDRIFNKRNHRLNKSKKESINHAIKTCHNFLDEMEKGRISLSRGPYYADKTYIDQFLSKYELDPEIKNQEEDNSSEQPEKDTPDSQETEENRTNEKAPEDSSGPQTDTGGRASEDESSAEKGTQSQKYSIGTNPDVEKELKDKKYHKLHYLYYSITTLSYRSHAIIVYVGCWSFFESLNKALGGKDSFDNLAGKAQSWGFGKDDTKTFRKALKNIQDHGNTNKHHATHGQFIGEQLQSDMISLDPLIKKAVQNLPNL